MVNKRSCLMIILEIISLLIIAVIPSYSMASDPISNPGYYDPSGSTVDLGTGKIVEKANIIIGVIKTIGIVVSVLVLIVLGIKFMIGSVEEKAEYKKTMIPYLIGAVMIFAIPQFVQIIYNIVTTSSLN